MSRSSMSMVCGLIAVTSLGVTRGLARPLAHTQPNGAVRRVWAGDQVDDDGSPSPDGRVYAYSDSSGDLILRDLEKGTQRRLGLTRAGTSLDYPRYSPDGKQIAYVWWEKNEKGNQLGDALRVIGVDSLHPRVLVPPGDQEIIPQDWTPDGKFVVYVVAHGKQSPQLAMVPTSGGAPRVLKSFTDWREPGTVRMRVSPDGRFIAYSFPSPENDGRHDVSLLSVEDGRDAVIFRHVASDYVVGWSADGARLAFASDRGGSPGIWSLSLRNGKPSGDPVLVRGELWHMEGLRVTPRGDFFYAVRSGDRDIFSASIDMTTGKLQSTPTGITQRPGAKHGYPSWSPDGKYIAFATTNTAGGGNGSNFVTIRSLERGDVREFRPKVSYINALTWMPNSQALALRAKDDKGREGLLRLDLKTGEVTPLLRPFRGLPIFSHDGRWMYYMAADSTDAFFLKRTDRSRLVARELSTGNEHVVYTPPAGYVMQGSTAVAPLYTLTADDQFIVFPISDGENPAEFTDYKVMVAPVAGGPGRELPKPVVDGGPVRGVRIVGASPDQRAAIVVARPAKPAGLWLMPIDGSPARLIGDGPADIAVLVLSPDGRRAAFPKGTASLEMWVMEDSALRGTPSRPGSNSPR